MAKADKAVNGLDCVKEALLNVKDNEKLIEHIEYAQRAIEEQDERIAIMQESDSFGGLFLEVLEKYRHSESEVISECSGKEEDERALDEEIREYLKRAADCGFSSVPVYEIKKGHGRMGVERDENGFIALWFVTEEYKEPGIQNKEAPVDAVPVFGLRIRDAKHAEIVSESFAQISGIIAAQTERAKE